MSTTISQPLTLNRGRFVQIPFDPNGGTPGLVHDLTQLIEELLDPERYASDQDPYTLVNYIMGVDRRLGFNIYSHYQSTHLLRLKIGYIQAPACNLSATATSEELATALFPAEGGASDGLIFASFLNAAEKAGHDVQELLRLGYAKHRDGFERVMQSISPNSELHPHDANSLAILLKGADFWTALDEVAPSCKAARAMRRLKLIHKAHRLPFVGYAIWRQGTPYQKYLIDALEG